MMRTIYFKNTVSTDETIFKRDSKGNFWTKFRSGGEVITNESRSAQQSFYLCLREVPKKEYDSFQDSIIPWYEDYVNNIFMYHVPIEIKI
jgi:hypothetical protein